MAYALHSLVTFGGTIGTAGTPSADGWQCGVRIGADVGDGRLIPVPNAASYATTIAGALKTWWTTGAGTYAKSRSDMSLDWCKVAQIDTTGKYVAGIPSEIRTIAQAGSTGATVPPFLAVAVSWTTALSRGRGHAGRVYLPVAGGVSAGTLNSSVMPSTYAADFRDWGKALLTALHQTDSGATMWPVVASRLSGTLNRITGVRCGSVVDVQRRRKEQVNETYVSTTFP